MLKESINKSQHISIGTVNSVMLLSDTMILIAVIWQALELGITKLHIGGIMSTMAIVPWLLIKLFPRLKGYSRSEPTQFFVWVRLVSLILLVGVWTAFYQNKIIALYLIAFISSGMSYYSNQIMETLFSYLVIGKHLSPQSSSRALQTHIQIGSFGGALLGGLIMSDSNFEVAFYFLLGLSSLGLFYKTVYNRIFVNIKQVNSSPIKEKVASEKPVLSAEKNSNNPLFFFMATGIAAITCQVGAFNFSIPIYLQEVKNWNASVYGLMSAFAGFGALFASFPQIRIALVVPFSLVFILDYLLIQSNNSYLSFGLCFILGFSVNYIRIRLREVILSQIENHTEAAEWSERCNTMSFIARTGFPVVLAVLLSSFDFLSIGNVFVYCGLIISLFLFASYYPIKILQNKKTLKTKEII